MKLKFVCFFIIGITVISLASLLCAIFFSPKPELLGETKFGKVVLASDGSLLRMSLTADAKYRLYVPLDEIAPEAVNSVLAYEDQYFYLHPGINVLSILRAAVNNLSPGTRKLGASTLTMQVARLRFGIKSSCLAGKIKQMWHALVLERHYSKNKILEAYFNLAPYGGNIEGIEAAARIYFHKAAAHLTISECRALTVIPQNPGSRNPVNGTSFSAARRRLNNLFEDNESVLPNLDIYKPADQPFLTPHLAGELIGDNGINSTNIKTGIVIKNQKLLESSIFNFVEQNKRYNLTNASAMLVNAQTMEVVALAGSANFYDDTICGQIDGTNARRSPGSTLKPFIYALALDQGLIHPHTILNDTPRSFGGYDPENFDKGFKGPLPAKDALKASRNLPAISLAEKLKSPGLYDFLINAGINLRHPPDHYGLALALGGAEITMRELAALYGSLYNSGLWQPLKFTSQDSKASIRRLLSPEASWLALWMLQREDLKIFSNGLEIPVYCKTGTSNGLRDAWTAGIIGNFILIVWVGNFDNSSNPYLVGGQTALPLFMDIGHSLGRNYKLQDPLKQPYENLNLQKVDVCLTTGDIARDNTQYFTDDLNIAHCPQTGTTFIIPGVSPIKNTQILRSVLIDKETGLRVCDNFHGNAQERFFEFWPTEIMRTFESAGISKPKPPDWHPVCSQNKSFIDTDLHSEKKPGIILPKKNVTYNRRVKQNNWSLPLQASCEPDVKKISWYIQNQYLGSSRPGETIFWHGQANGKIDVLAVDDKGRSEKISCKIETIP